jgi:triphosphatase
MKRGKRIDSLDAEGLHELRKELKKLRYSVELLAPLHSGKRQRAFLKALKTLQDDFGALNDAAAARDLLDPPVDAEWRVQRGAGFMLGRLAAEAEAARAGLGKRWKRFASVDPFWR